jgi:hypothetical protein
LTGGCELVRDAPDGAARRSRRLAHPLVEPERLEVGVLADERTALWIDLDRACEARQRLGEFSAFDERHASHVVRVVAARIGGNRPADVRQREVQVPGVECQRGRVEALLGIAGRGRRRLALADVEVQDDPLVKFLLFWITREHRPQQIGGGGIIVSPKSLECPLVQGNRFNVASPRWLGLGRLLVGWTPSRFGRTPCSTSFSLLPTNPWLSWSWRGRTGSSPPLLRHEASRVSVERLVGNR